jgi:pimeloyl-ACP methyl ester carboxylesterase
MGSDSRLRISVSKTMAALLVSLIIGPRLALLGPFVASAQEAPIPRAGSSGSRPLARIEQFAPPGEFVMVGSIKTHHITRGERGRPIVLVHGFGSSTYTWRRNLDALSDWYRVYALDLKGFGLTAKPRDGQYHVSAYTDHLLGYLDVMKLERPVLVASSMGGAVATRLALLHADRVGGLILIDPAPVRLPAERVGEDERSSRNMAVEKSAGSSFAGRLLPAVARTMITRQAVEGWLKASYHDPSLVTAELVETYYRPITIDGATEALAAMMKPPAAPAIEVPSLQSLLVPTLVIWGKHDRIVPRPVAEDYTRAIKGSRLAIFERSGHLPHEEEPGRFHQEVFTFVDHLP